MKTFPPPTLAMQGGDQGSRAQPAPIYGCRALGRPGGEAMTEVRHLVITGRVQGVGFRYAMAAQARLLGVTGWVRNRRDGTVEAMVAGAAEPVASMLAWSHHGPAGASVDHVMVEIGSGEFFGFESLPTA